MASNSNVITVSLVANFDSSAGGSLSAEFDSRLDGYNKGVTSFVPGDSPAFLVFKSSDVTLIDPDPPHAEMVYASAGEIVVLGSGTVEVKEDLQFLKTNQANLSKPLYSGFAYKWLGNNLGLPVASEGRVVVPTAGIGLLRVTYNALFKAYRLANVPNPLNGEKSYAVLIAIFGVKE